MADNEEKYFIHKVWGETIIQGNKFTTFHNDYGVEFTRQEAIEVMARAICKEEQHDMTGVCCDEICLKWKYFLPQAQSALNALLEGGK